MTESCVQPGLIQEWELDAFADGEALPHVAQHLAHCPACRARLPDRQTLETRLRHALYRSDCPALEILRDYHWGHLPVDEMQRVRTHVDACSHCRLELAELAQSDKAAGEYPGEKGLLERARQAVRLLVAQFVSPNRSLAPRCGVKSGTPGCLRLIVLR